MMLLVPSTSSQRIASLDGLRGLAAIVVVFHHTALAVPALLAASKDGTGNSGWVWWLTNTPLHLAWAGTEAVFVFFVLSGFVLTIPFLTSETSAWGRYYQKRLLRLYLPVWGAIVFALILWAIFGRSSSTGNWWVNAHAARLGLVSLIGDLTLMSPSLLDGVLWSLKWEVAFSLLLPVYVALAIAGRRLGMWTLLVPPALVFAGVIARSDALTYLPMFLLGSLLATRVRASSAEKPLPRPIRLPLGVVTVALLTQGWWVPWGEALGTALAVVGAALTLLVVVELPTARGIAEHRITQSLGRWSFSLYLVHLPIVITLVGVAAVPLAVLPPLALALSLCCAAIFHRLVESPAQAIARKQRRSGPLILGRGGVPEASSAPISPQNGSLNVD
jgi:peptidoglycan/LPS O-acetylase OafA/YrhL